MLAKLTKTLFHLHAGEGSKVLHFALLGAILQAGISIGFSTSDTLFLTHIGAQSLPNIYLLTPLVFLFYIPIYTFLIGRIGIDRVFDLTMLLIVFGGMALSFLLGNPSPQMLGILIYAAKLYSVLWYLALYTLFWNFVDGYFDILDAKRLFSLLSAGSALGAALGGAAVSFLVDYIKVEELFLIWSALALLSLLAVMTCRKKFKRIEVEDLDSESRKGLVEQTKSLFHVFRNSKFALTLGATLFFTMIVTLICEYQYSTTFAKGRSEAELARLFGTLFFGVNIINLFTNLFVFNRLVLIFGVRNVALVQPLCYAATFIIFLLDDSYSAGLVGFFAYHGMLTSIDYNNTNLLLNALPTESKKQLRTFIEGICEPVANAFAGAFLICVMSYLNPIQISTIGLSLAIFCLFLVFTLRSAYIQSMLANLKQGWLDFANSQKEHVSSLEDAELESLKLKASSHVQDRNSALHAIEFLILNKSTLAVDCLLAFIDSSTLKDQSVAVYQLNRLLESNNKEITENILNWASTRYAKLNLSLLEVLARYGLIPTELAEDLMNSQVPMQQSIAAVVLRGSIDASLKMKSLQAIQQLLAADEESKLAGIKAIGNFGLEEYAQFLLPYIKSENKTICNHALEALLKIVGPTSSALVPEILSIFPESHETEREVCLKIFSKIADTGCIKELLLLSDSLTPAERRKIEEVLFSIGLKSIPSSLSVLRSYNYSYKARSIAARSIAKLSFPQLEAASQELISTEIQRAYQFISYQWLLESQTNPKSGIKVLSRYYKDCVKEAIEFFLELMTLSGKLANFELIAASLRSENQKDRSNAIETVQEACSRRIHHVLLPLLVNSSLSEKVLIFRRYFSASELSLHDLLMQAISSKFAIESASAMQAAWDISKNQTEMEAVKIALTKRLANVHKNQNGATLIIDTIVGLRCREEGSDFIEPTPIEKISLFLGLEFFSIFPLQELYSLACHSKISAYEKHSSICKAGDNAQSLFVLSDGTVSSSKANIIESHSGHKVLGQQNVFGSKVWNQSLTSDGCILMKVAIEDILALARLNVEIAKGLLVKRFECDSSISSWFEVDETISTIDAEATA